MDFTYDEEQQALREAVRGLVGKSYSDFETRRRTVADEPGFDEKLWTRLAEMGVLGLPFDEAYGGMGAGPVEVGIVAQEIGRVLAPEPFLTSVVLAGGVVALAGTEEQKASLLEALGSGRDRAGLRPRRARHPLGQHGRGRDGVRLRRRSGRSPASRSRCPSGPAPTGSWSAPGSRTAAPALFLVAGDAAGADPVRLRHLRRWPRRPGRAGRHPRHSPGLGHRRVRAHRPGARRRPDRGLQRGDRRHAVRPDRHLGVPQEPQAVRRAAQDLPGADVPGRRHVRLARARDQRRDLGDDGARVRHRRGGRRGGGARRAAGQPGVAARRPGGDPAARRHRDDRGVQRGQLHQPPHRAGPPASATASCTSPTLSAAIGDHDEVDPLP